MSETSASVGAILEHIAQLLELKGENPFKIRAYTNAARALESLSEPIEKIVAEERLGQIEGIGKAITEKVKTNRDHVVATLNKFGAKKGTELKAEQYAEFLEAL